MIQRAKVLARLQVERKCLRGGRYVPSMEFYSLDDVLDEIEAILESELSSMLEQEYVLVPKSEFEKWNNQ